MLNESVFIKEFKTMMKQRRENVKPFSLSDLYAHELQKNLENEVLLSGIDEEFYNNLNSTTATVLYRQKVYKPQYLSSGEIRRDSEGNVVKDYIPVPRECVLIKSETNIKLRRVSSTGVEYQEKEEFQYITFKKDKDNYGKEVRYYYYIIPRKYVYKLNINALILSQNRRKSYYKAYKIALTDGNYVFLSVVPANYHKNGTTLLIQGHPTTNFDDSIGLLVLDWEQKGFIFNRSIIHDDILGNIGIEELEPTLEIEDYTAVDSLITQIATEEEI